MIFYLLVGILYWFFDLQNFYLNKLFIEEISWIWKKIYTNVSPKNNCTVFVILYYKKLRIHNILRASKIKEKYVGRYIHLL